MRIAVDARPLNHMPNGIGRYLASVLEHLIELGAPQRDQWCLYLDHDISLDDYFPRHLHQFVSTRSSGVTSGLRSTFNAQRYFPRWCTQDQADLFWSPRHHLPRLPAQVKSLLTIHDLVWKTVPDTMRLGGRIVEWWLMPRSLRAASAIVTPSRATADDIAKFYPNAGAKVTVTPLGVSLPGAQQPATQRCAYPSLRAGEPLRLAMISTIEPRKNVARVLAAIRLVLQAGQPVQLKLAGGRGWKSEAVLAELKTWPKEQVEFLGVLQDDKLSELIQSSHAVIAPSLYEGFGLSIAEAISLGRPVITSKIASMPEVAGNAGILVNPYAIEAIADGILEMARDHALRERLASNALARAGEFDWHSTAQATYSVMRQLVA